jgi:hypothetical protein
LRSLCYPDNSNQVICQPQIRTIEYNPLDPSQVFIGTESAGVFFSDDGGTSWEKIAGSDPIVAVTAFAFDQVTEDVYVSSYGRGLWRLRKIDLVGIPPPDAFEPNDSSSNVTSIDLEDHRHYDPRVAEDYAAVYQSEESWSGGLSGLTLHDRDDVDFFNVRLPDLDDHVPDLPDGPVPDPMPFCGDITRRSARSRLGVFGDETIMFRGVLELSTTLTNDDGLKTGFILSGPSSKVRRFPCAPLGSFMRVVVGDRTDLIDPRDEFQTYGLGAVYRVGITRISAEAEWLRRRLRYARDFERVFPLPCPDGFFPDCPSDMGGPVQVELDHPFVTDCFADGPGCREFHPFWWSSDAPFELAFTSDVDLAIDLRDERGQTIAEAQPMQRGAGSFVKQLVAPDLQPGFYVLTMTGPQASYTLEFDEFPPAPDSDGDGIVDPFDLCPLDAEDPDGIRDGDGCKEEPGDIDGDGIPDTQDNCVNTPDPSAVDNDGDGRGDSCDCDAGDPSVWAPPGDVCDVRFDSPTKLGWTAADGGPGTVHEVIRGALDDLPATGDGGDVCVAGNLAENSFEDFEQPFQGEGFRYSVLARNACGTSWIGPGRGTTADCSAQSCSHSKCVAGSALSAACDTCVGRICAADPFCCDNQWDSICVGRVASDCGLAVCGDPGSGCSHDICTAGEALVSGCDATGLDCVTAVCASDPFCCNTVWDDLCRHAVGDFCGLSCE